MDGSNGSPPGMLILFCPLGHFLVARRPCVEILQREKVVSSLSLVGTNKFSIRVTGGRGRSESESLLLCSSIKCYDGGSGPNILIPTFPPLIICMDETRSMQGVMVTLESDKDTRTASSVQGGEHERGQAFSIQRHERHFSSSHLSCAYLGFCNLPIDRICPSPRAGMSICMGASLSVLRDQICGELTRSREGEGQKRNFI